ncbi:peptidoglycan-binding protein [Bosea sp. R86505]|uniref:peptidoglycan-binding domain-containing protein n=1 Tax=Bosea sp. R86505 TaxID=3101710 RepID=UPI00366BED00
MATASITPKQYIGWVQRSLNRLLGCSLISDGIDSEPYRDQVKEFKFGYALGPSAQVGVAEQNALIKANHLTPEYVAWAQAALNAVGASMGAPITGTMSTESKASVKSFQAYEGLVDDGWIGAQTEVRLMARSGLVPPGHVTAGTPPKKPKPPVKPPQIDPLPPEKRMERVVNAIIYEIQFKPQVYPNTQQRKRVACLMLKIKKKIRGEWIGGKRVDDSYISKGGTDYPRQYALGMGPLSYSGGAIVEDLELSAAETLQRNIMRLPPSKRTQQNAIRKVVLALDYDIEGALNSISNVYNVHGDSNMGAKLLHEWGMAKQKRPESILSCYN